MSSRPLAPLVALSVKLSATMSRNRYATDPGPVIAELRELAGEHTDLLAYEAGLWGGFYETHDYVGVMAEAMRQIGDPEAVELGRHRYRAGSHHNP